MRTSVSLAFWIFGSSLATNPCERLCARDGPDVCTDGSWPRGNVCHAYFRRPDGRHCYHNGPTRDSCPDSLPALTVAQANEILGGPVVPSERPQPPLRANRTVVVPPTGARITPEEAANAIRARFGTSQGYQGLAVAIADALTRITVPTVFSEEDAMHFWIQCRGPELLREANSLRSSRRYEDDALSPLIYLISFMPLPNTHESSAILFLERTDVMLFVDNNIEEFRNRLRIRHQVEYFGFPGESLAIVAGYARNWIERFPQIIGYSQDLRNRVLRHRIVYFLRHRNPSRIIPNVNLDMDRADPLGSTTRSFARVDDVALRYGQVSVRYRGENAGGSGLTNEYFSMFASAVTNPSSSTALFVTHSGSGYERMIPGIRNHDDRYRTLGRFLALSFITSRPTGIRLPVTFFKYLLGHPVTLDDVAIFDEVWVRSAMLYMRATTQAQLLAFSMGVPEPLPGSGASEPLTLENRNEQMQQAIVNIVTNNSPDQFAAIAEGFFAIIPREMIDGFTGEDLHFAIVGMTDIGAADLLAHIQFSGIPSAQLGWFRAIVNGFTPGLRQRLLRFITGLSVVPSGGWSALNPISVIGTSRFGANGRVAYPHSQACLSTMRLPLYESEEEMRTILTNVLERAMEAGMEESSRL